MQAVIMTFLSSLKKYRYKQYVYVIMVSVLQSSHSLVSSWISPVLPILLSEETPLNAPLTDTEQTWVVSGDKLGGVVGCMTAALLTDLMGRKFMLLAAAIPHITSMLITLFVKSAVILIILRLLCGVGSGIALSVLPVYVSEISDKDIRGQFGIVQLMLSVLGTVYIYSVGPFVSYYALTLSVPVFPSLFLFFFYFIPETPYFLVKKGKIEAATKSLKKLSLDGLNDDIIASKLQEIQEFVDKDAESKGALKELLFSHANRKALIIILVLKTVLALSGLFVLLNYLQKLIEDSGSNISPETSSIIFGVINLLSAFIGIFLIDTLGRRPLFLVSTFGSALTSIAIGIYFYLKEYGDVSYILWLPTTCLCIFVVFAFLGIRAVSDIMQGEMFSINAKSVASSVIMIYSFGANFFMLKFFHPLSEKLGLYGVFWIFGISCALGLLFGIFFLPETKGKTFLEIQEMLNNRHNSKKKD